MRYQDECRWTFRVDADPISAGNPTPPPPRLEKGTFVPGGDPWKRFDVCAIEVANDGSLVSTTHPNAKDQLYEACDAITQARSTPSGALVVVFVHGWHNNPDWDNKNFAKFRNLLASLSLRESEFANRRVVGVYLGWEGAHDESSALSRMMSAPILKLATFASREQRAEGIGASGDVQYALGRIVEATKGGEGAPGSIALIGHSMGGLILEHVCEGWALDGGVPEWPDVVLLVNPASSASGTAQLQQALRSAYWTPRPSGQPGYEFPLIISATSKGDWAIGKLFPIAKRLRSAALGKWSVAFGDWPVSAGFTAAMHTHEMIALEERCEPPANGELDFGQHWHQLRFAPHSEPVGDIDDPQPHFRISLPIEPDDRYRHLQYALVPRAETDSFDPMWIFQVPNDVVDDHSDIFNFAAASLFLALMQLSGALAGPYDKVETLFADAPECPDNCAIHGPVSGG